jgi:hypothetical protein
MTHSVGSLLRRAAVGVCLTLTFVSRGFAQQSPPTPGEAPASLEFMSRYDFHLSADELRSHDVRFAQDMHVGGNFDLVDYIHGRTTLLADYEVVLGTQYRPFDPNQGIYRLEAATSWRIGRTEVFAVLHHVSRHLSDRGKLFSIAWNVLDVRVMRRLTVNGTTIDLRGDLGKVVQHSYVDYSWTADANVLVQRPLARHVGAFASGYVETFGTNPQISVRPQQTGGRLEGGVRLSGRRGAAELFVGYERVVDADPIQALPLSWAFAGFRFVAN